MQYALIDGERVEATPNARGTCPFCEADMHAKCGDINIHHWAHVKNENCDSWYEPESSWHREWKLLFPKEQTEVIIKKEGIRHIADICTASGLVIELQNSPILSSVIYKRELFYGEKMLWIINGNPFKDNFSYSEAPNYDEVPNVYDPKLYPERWKWQRDLILKERYKEDSTFSWRYAKKSWQETMRPIFIDVGDDKLFCVKTGMGSRRGTGTMWKKSSFLTKYNSVPG